MANGELAAVLDPVLAVLSDHSPSSTPYVRVVPARTGAGVALPPWVPPAVVAALKDDGIEQVWAHQAQAADMVWGGQHVVLATGPSSGKTLAYQLPVLSGAVTDGSTSLYLSPTTALAADQAARLHRLGVPGVTVAALDGDSHRDQRRWARETAQVVLTTPDLLHHSILPGHEQWARFLRRLRVVVVDECHLYRGVFGAHVAAVFRRLRRLAVLRGADPSFVACSATAAHPGRFATELCGVEFAVVSDDSSPHPGSATVVHAAPSGRAGSAAHESADLLADLVNTGLQVALFTSSRRRTETSARRARRRAPSALTDSIVSYRGGHMAEERRAVESGLRDQSVRGVVTTSALEVGVDVAGMDVVVLDGWPGSMTALTQRAGRAGRGSRCGVAVLVAGDDPIDAHLLSDPDLVLSQPIEAGVTDADNPYVLAPHLALAAAESPLTDDDLATFGPAAPGVVQALADRGDLRPRPGGWFWARAVRPGVADIRSAGTPTTLVEEGTGRVLGTVDEARTQSAVHPGAVYLHRSDTYVVTEWDPESRVAVLTEGDPGWVTVARQTTVITRLGVDSARDIGRDARRDLGLTAAADRCLPDRLGFGTVEVTRTVPSFLALDATTGAVISETALDLPPRTFVTRAVWWSPGDLDADAPALHAAEHVLLAMLPLVVPCERWDLGAHVGSWSGAAAVTVFDAWPGGAGFAERAFAVADDWLAAARRRLRECECLTGCPSCVVAVACERRNTALDKAGAARLLG